MALRLSFIGPPSSGKRTQALALRQNGFVCARSGELLRTAAGECTVRGVSIREVLARGGAVDDAVLFELMRAFFDRHPNRPVVVVGYPRNVHQAEQLAELSLDAAVFFDASDETMMRRVGNCLIGPGGHVNPPVASCAAAAAGRTGADALAYRARLAEYRQQEAPLRAFYTQAGLARSVLAGYPQPTVRAQIADLIADLYVARNRQAPGA